MTRMDSVRAATDSAKESVLHAAEVVAPYAGTAKDQAALYAHETRARIAPKVNKAAKQARFQARTQYDAYVAPHVPPKVDEAAHRAALQTRKSADVVRAVGDVLRNAVTNLREFFDALLGKN